MQLTLNIPDELFLTINETQHSLVQQLKEELILKLYKNHKISISQGANYLDTDIYSFMKLLNAHQIPVIDDYDIEAELEALKDI
jgi:predicted HTH domain antitoxin